MCDDLEKDGMGEKSPVWMILLILSGKWYGPGGPKTSKKMPSSRYRYEDLISDIRKKR